MGSSGTIKSMLQLVGGNVLSQIIVFAAIPLLSRVYSPADFGVAGEFMAVAGMLMVVACLRYESSILLSDDGDVSKTFGLSIVSGGVLSVFTLLSVLLLMLWSSWTNRDFSAHWLLLPLFIISNSFILAARYRYTRDANYGVQIKSNVIRSIVLVATQLLIGLVLVSGLGLILGQVVAICLCAMYLCYTLYRGDRDFYSLEKDGLATLAQRYKHFLFFGVPQTMCSAAGYFLPVILLGVYYSDAIIGVYFMLIKLMTKPLQIVSDAVRRVLMNKFSKQLRSDSAGLWGAMISWSLVLGGVAGFIFVPFGLYGADLVIWVLGDEWADVRALVPWFCLLMIGSMLQLPSSICLQLLERQKLLMFIDAGSLVMRSCCIVLLGGILLGEDVIKCLCLIGFITYLLMLVIAARVASKTTSDGECD